MMLIKNLCFAYGDELALKNISLEIKEGSFTVIIGANGSGKTTLAKHLNALLLPASGNVFIDGVDTKKDELNARKKVGFVFQNFEDQIVYPVVEDDIAFGLENLGLKTDEISKIVNATLARLRIKHLAEQNVNMLSIGQKQLVALAGILAMKPKCIVFDEPTTNLDARNKKNIMNIIKELNKKDKITIIFVTNDLKDLKYANNVFVLKGGSIIFNDKKLKLSTKVLKEAGLYD